MESKRCVYLEITIAFDNCIELYESLYMKKSLHR
jgi:hypothetical protein